MLPGTVWRVAAEQVLSSFFLAINMAQRIDLKDIGDVSTKPYQPHHISFPPRRFGKQPPVQRSFQSSWFGKRQWLHYDVAQDAVRCFTCCKAVRDGRAIITGQAEGSFSVNGFTNLKDATTKFAKHESSNFHKACAEALSSTVDIGDMLNKHAVTEKQANREYLLKVLSTVRFFWARQDLALRGDGDECDSNVH